MTFSKQNLLIGAAAAALLAAGLTAGVVLFGGDRSHVGESLESTPPNSGLAFQPARLMTIMLARRPATRVKKARRLKNTPKEKSISTPPRSSVRISP